LGLKATGGMVIGKRLSSEAAYFFAKRNKKGGSMFNQKKLWWGVVAAAFLFIGVTGVHAEGLTPELAKQKVEAASKLVAAEGDAALAKIKDPNGEFRFAGGEGYIWVHNLEGIMLMHPIKPALDNTNVLPMTDPDGFTLFVAMNEVVTKSGAGWVPYKWPKPGQKGASPKISYVKLVKFGGKSYVVGCGLYDVTAADIKAKFPSDAIYTE
jgi:hypothetical protein